MKIAACNCSKDIIHELEAFGYDITDFASDTSPADAILYSGSMTGAFQSHVSTDSNGIFVINADGKTADEIDNILQKRLYSPIFYF